jgi:hypothetical protein
MNYWICSMKLLEVKLKKRKKLHMLPLKVLPVCIRIRRNKQLILKN